MSERKLISIVSPCYNEEENIPHQFDRVRKAIEPFQGKYDFEHIYTDNCSHDNTFEVLSQLAQAYKNVRIMRFSNNIGYNRAIFMGLKHSKGDAVILIQSDLQDPPEMIPQFIEGWEQGNDVVYGKILDRNEGFILKNLRKLFYYLIDAFSEVSVPRNAGDFRLTSRRVCNALLKYEEDDPYIRGAIARIGFKQLAVPYKRHARERGKSSFRIFFLFTYAINSFVSTTVAPIRFVSTVGLLFSLIGFFLTGLIITGKIFFPDQAPRGFASLASLITFFAGLQLLGIGIIGEYLRKTYLQTLNRPLGFIDSSSNLE
jgi:glycosyltransferase involved in cell wall biosynthesis